MHRRPTLASLVAGAFLALGASSAVAAEGGMPQLNFHDFPPQLVWLAISFILLYAVMNWVALPKVGAVLQERADRIKGDLDRATALKAETDKAIATYEKALADARNNAATVGRETAAVLAKQSAERQTGLGAQLGERIKTAEAGIAAAKTKALTEIQGVAAEIAADAAKRLVGIQVSADEAKQAVASAMRERA